MLNLKRGKRVFSVILVAVMLFAAVFAAIGFSSAESKYRIAAVICTKLAKPL